jgi:O-antigen ligase
MKNHFFFDTIPFWIIILMPALLISGPFLSDLGVSIVAISFLINSKKNKLRKYYNNYYFKIFFLFCLILVSSSLLSNNIIISLKNSLFYFRFGIFTLCFWYLLEKKIYLIRYLFFSFLICFIVLIVDGYIQYIFGKNLIGYELYSNYRVSSFFGSELILGSYLARFFPVLFGLFICLDEPRPNKSLLSLLTLTFILCEGLIFLSGERLALFFMNLSAVYIILMLKKYRIYRLWTYICSLCLIIVLLNVFPNSKERIINQTIEDFTTNTSTDKHDQFYIFSKPHNDMYISAFRIFLDNKFFGVGPRQFRNTCDQYVVSEYSCETHPHHTYIELLSEAGIFAFIIVTIVFLLICYISIKHLLFKLFKNKEGIINDLEVCLLASIIISLWPFSPSGSFFNNWMSIVYYFPVGIFLWQRSLKQIPKKYQKHSKN